MTPPRYPFTVSRGNENTIIAMDFGKGHIRTWEMQEDMLLALGMMCEEGDKEAKETLLSVETIPPLPQVFCVMEGDFDDVILVKYYAYRVEDGPTGRMIVLYDVEGGGAPLLYLIDDQIEEFITLTKRNTQPEPHHERRSVQP